MKSRDERIKRLSEGGLSVAEIAEAVGLSRRQVGRIRNRLGLSQAPALLSGEQRKQIRHLSEVEGWPPEEIAATMGISLEAACRWAVYGPGKQWAAVASVLSRKYPQLFRELRRSA